MKTLFLIMFICVVVLSYIKVSANQQNIVEKDGETRYYANYYEPYFDGYTYTTDGTYVSGCPLW